MVAFAGVEAFAAWFWLFVGRHGWFYLDEWDFLATRSAGSLGDLFRPHNEHWVTLPVLVYRLLYSWFGLREYLPYRIVGVAVYLAVPALLLVVMRRAGVNPWIASSAAALVALFGSSWQNAVEPFQITFTGSLVLGLVYLLVVDHDGPLDWRDALGLFVGLLALMTSGVAVVMVIVVGFAVFIRRGVRIALFHVVPLGACYLAWLTVEHSQVTSPRNLGTNHVTVSSMLSFVGSGLRLTFGQLGPFSHVSGILEIIPAVAVGIGLVVALMQHPNDWRARMGPPVALLIGSVAFLAVTAIGRSNPTAPRVLSVAAATMIPALAVAADALVARRKLLVPVAMVVFLVGIPQSMRGAAVAQHSQDALLRLSRGVLETLPLDPLARKVPPLVTPESNVAWRVTIGWLLGASQRGDMPTAAKITPAEVAADNFRLSLYREVSPPPTTRCLVAHPGLILRMRKGDTIGVFDNALSLAPAADPLRIQPHLIFVPSESTRILAVRNLGHVRVIPLNSPLYPRICTTAQVFANPTP